MIPIWIRATSGFTHSATGWIARLEDQPYLEHAVYYAPEPESIRDLIVGNYR